jgi:DNA-binding transcriptional regulator YhcF (GntR family)
MTNDEIVDRVLNMLEKQKFADWHEGKFIDFISGDMKHNNNLTQEECRNLIKQDLAKMLHLT